MKRNLHCGNCSATVGAKYAELNIVCLAFGCVFLFLHKQLENKNIFIFYFSLLACLETQVEDMSHALFSLYFTNNIFILKRITQDGTVK